MARLPDDVIKQIKSTISLLRLVESQGYQPKKQGKDYVVSCPFHNDKTPSLVISPKTNLYHCFGCGAAGSVIDWVIKTQGVSFRHAVEILRNDLPTLAAPVQPVTRSTVQKMEVLLSGDSEARQLLNQVVSYYHETLLQNPEALDYQQTYVDTYAKVAHCKLYTTKTPITAADLLNDRVLPFYASHELPVLRILTDRGTEYCGKLEQHDYQLYLSVNEIEHTKTKARHPQTNGICERFHKTILQEFYQPSLRRKIYGSLEDLQMDLDEWLNYYNNERTHQGKKCCGRTPVQTLEDGKKIWMEKFVN